MVDYKLRLGDGTTFSVDEKGLNTWLQGGLVDDKARVQPAGSKKWFSLKQVLAAQGAQRGHAERQTEKGRADVDRQAAQEVAEIERRVAEQRAAEERKAAEDLAAAERKAEEDRTAAERQLLEERANAERRAADERKAAEERAAAEKQAERERLEAEKRAKEEHAAAERSAAEAAEAARVADAEKQVAAERAERAERKRKAEEARLEAEQRAAEDARLEAERKAAAEQAAARKAADERAAAERRAAEAREAAAREAERVAEAERLVAAERAERAERKRRADGERLAEQRLAEPRVAEQHPEERLAKERAAEDLAAKEQAVRDRAIEAFHVPDSAEPPATEIAIEPAATMVKVEDFERELGLVPVAFSDGMDAAGAPVAPAIAGRAAASPSSPERAPSPPGTDAPSFMAIQTPAAVDNVVLRLVKVLDVAVVGLVRTLGPLVGHTIARAVRSLRGVGPKVKALLARRATPPAAPADTATEPAPPVAPSAAAPDVSVPAPRPAPPAAVPRPAPPAAAPRPAPPAAAGPAPAPWAAPPPAPWVPPASAKAPTPAPRAAPIKPATPPPSFDKMEVIPFAAAPATSKAADDDVWEDEDEWQEPSRVSSAFSTLWLWVKRVTIATALIVAAALLALNREKWLPQAKSAATVLGEGVDKLSERASTRTVPPQAIEAARAELPHIRPDTIELVMSRSTERALEPAEVFRRAHVAAEHARASLPPHVIGELDSLTAAATAGLEEGEAARLRAYLAEVRAGTPTADYQDTEAVWLMARGVRRLPAERVARLQELMAQAVAKDLEPKPQP